MHVISVRGNVDVAFARGLERRLRDLMLAGKSTIVVDISEAEELAPSLLGALIRVQRSLSWRNGRLLLACEEGKVRDQLTFVGLPDLFELVDADELERLGGAPPQVPQSRPPRGAT